MKKLYLALFEASAVPAEGERFERWVEQQDSPRLLEANLHQDDFVLYASLPHVFMHAVAVPASSVDPPDVRDLMEWNLTACGGWGVWHDFTDPPSIRVSSPMEGSTSSVTLAGGEQLVFIRHFEGRIGRPGYVEILQKLLHVLDLHFLSERGAYCRLDKHGDVEEVIRIIMRSDRNPGVDGLVVTIKREDLDRYLVLTESVGVMMFDFTRFNPETFSGWPGREHDEQLESNGDLSYRRVLVPRYGSYLRGFHLVHPRSSPEEVARRIRSDSLGERGEYVEFLVLDLRDERVKDVSCGPGCTATYFNANSNDLPYEMSPAFFRPEVLAKYKADSDKYHLAERSITCRGAWSLETYDINEEGQVHTYLRYLRRLPYQEQLYWKAHNEIPKGPISRRAFEGDFEGRWTQESDPLQDLKRLLNRWHRRSTPWWSLRSDRLPEKVNYPATTSADEWANEILILDQLVIEGFEERWLRNRARELGAAPEPGMRSLKLLEGCLVALGFDGERARSLTQPLHEIHTLRSKVRGHATGEALEIKQEVLAKHGSFRAHFRAMCSSCLSSLQMISEALGGSSGDHEP